MAVELNALRDQIDAVDKQMKPHIIISPSSQQVKCHDT